jgi:hypothetical protein
MPKKELPEGWGKIDGTRRLTDDEFRELATKRAEARIDKNWMEADRLLKEINNGGYWIEDVGTGYNFGLLPDNITGGIDVDSRIIIVGTDEATEPDYTVKVLKPWTPGKTKG